MFDIGVQEILLIAVVAIIAIGPKDMPLALRTAGRWIGKLRKMSGQFRTGLDSMIREAEMEDMEKKWAEQNKKVMAEHPDGVPDEMEPTGAYPAARATDDIHFPDDAATEATPKAGSAEAGLLDKASEIHKDGEISAQDAIKAAEDTPAPPPKPVED